MHRVRMLWENTVELFHLKGLHKSTFGVTFRDEATLGIQKDEDQNTDDEVYTIASLKVNSEGEKSASRPQFDKTEGL